MPWKKGESGNAKGRKPGLTARGRFRKQVDAALPEIVGNVLQAALSGDMQATRLILDRCIPVLKATDDHITLPLPPGDLATQGEAVIQATTTGALTPEQARNLMGLLTSQAQLAELGEISTRLEAIEAWLHDKK
ncbi:MAG: hypothetical protein Q8O38_16630 [Sulfurimicrobium sp.]|nr:hypothetical protein [Sulfurimicrobium sp.]